MTSRLSKIFAILLVCGLFTGCWVRLPSRGPKEWRGYVGKSAVTLCPLYLHRDLEGGLTAGEDVLDGAPPTSTVVIVPAGSRVKAVSIISRRLPAGLFYGLVLRAEAPRVTFDYYVPWDGSGEGYPDDRFTRTFRWSLSRPEAVAGR